MSQKILRTPLQRFTKLPDYPWEPQWLTVKSDDDFPQVRMAWVESGVVDNPPVLMLHGEPSWSFLYRKMIPVFARAGYRAMAPDLIGFGRSDKPALTTDYTFARHVAWMKSFIKQLDLHRIHLVCQDWGGLIGLRLVADMPGRFDAVVVSNTFLPTGEESFPEAFHKWREFSQSVPELQISRVIDMGTVSQLSDEVLAAYDAPFPDETYKAGARVFPALVPMTPDAPGAAANRAAWEVLRNVEIPFLVAFGDSDPITGGAAAWFKERLHGAKGQPHTTIKKAGHFIQEDQGERLARAALDFFLEPDENVRKRFSALKARASEGKET